MDEDILIILIGGAVALIPVAGLTIRFALKPVVDSIARLMEIRADKDSSALLERRVALLEQEVQSIRMENIRLLEQKEFYQQLATPK